MCVFAAHITDILTLWLTSPRTNLNYLGELHSATGSMLWVTFINFLHLIIIKKQSNLRNWTLSLVWIIVLFSLSGTSTGYLSWNVCERWCLLRRRIGSSVRIRSSENLRSSGPEGERSLRLYCREFAELRWTDNTSKGILRQSVPVRIESSSLKLYMSSDGLTRPSVTKI